MSSESMKQGEINLLPKDIIALGKQLASINTYPAQSKMLINALKQHFGAESYIWLKTPPKSQSIKEKEMGFPFDPESLLMTDTDIENGFQIIEDEGSIWAIFPLVYGEQDIGKIFVKRETPFSPGTLESLKELSVVAGMAIYAALQTELQNWRQKQLSLVRSVTKQISQITDLDILTRQITKLIQQTFNYSYVAIFLINEENGRLHFKASALAAENDHQHATRPDFERETHPGFAIGEHMIGHVAETGQELIANDVTRETRYKEVDSLAETKSEAVIPLIMETRIIGVFDVQSNQPDAFNQNDLLVLRALADNIAIAIESTRLYQNVQNRADQLAAVSEVSRAITYILDIDELLQRIVNLIHERFDYPVVHLYTIDPTQKTITFKAGSSEKIPKHLKPGDSYKIDAKKGVLSWVIQHGKTKRISNLDNESLNRIPDDMYETTGSEMAVPLSFGSDILGVLDIQSNVKQAFSLEDQQLMETLADNIAIAIRNARLYRSEKWRRQVAESLRDIAGLLSNNSALPNVLNEILDQLHKNLPCDVAGIWLFSADAPEDESIESRELYLAAYQTSPDYSSTNLKQLTFIPDAWFKNALVQKMPTIRQPDQSLGPIARRYNLPQDYSSIAAPLVTGEEILGMLTLVHHTSGRYGLESQKITSTFASYAAIAIKNTRLYATSQEQAWISTILLQVATATQSLTNLDDLMATIVRLTPMIVGVKGCALFLREPESDSFSLYASHGFGDSAEELVLNQPLPMKEAPIFQELSVSQEPLRVRNPKEDFNLPDRFTSELSKDTLFLLPMQVRDEILGAFLLANDTESFSPQENDLGISEERFKIIQGIIQQTAVAVENIRLLEEKQEEAYVSTVLLQAAQAVVNSADLNDTLDSIVHIMPILVGIDASVIYLWDKNEEKFHTAHAAIKGSMNEEKMLEIKHSPGDFPMLDTVFHNNRPLVYPFIETILPPEDWDLALPDEGQTDPSPVLQSRYPLLMGFPLSIKNEVFGVLLAQDQNYATNRERRFDLLWGITQQASLAIQNDKLNKEMLDRQRFEREFQLAREIQQTFLPSQKPEMDGWQMDVRWDTARQVGGDFYDYFLLPDGRLAVVIADVSDKGLAASLYMTVTRTLLRAAALESNSSSETLERVNDLLLANSQNGLFVTTFYGILNLKDGVLTHTIAGHNPPLIIRYQQKDVIAFEKGGIALGALPDIHLEQNQTILNPGDCLVLYTDGVTEAFNLQDQMFGEERLKQVLQTTIGKNAHYVLEIVEADLKVFRGSAPLSDDTTILAICRSRSLADHDGNLSSS